MEPLKGRKRTLILALAALMFITHSFLTRRIARTNFLVTNCSGNKCNLTNRCKENLISRLLLVRFLCVKVCRSTSSHSFHNFKIQVPSQAYSPHSNQYRTIPGPVLSLQVPLQLAKWWKWETGSKNFKGQHRLTYNQDSSQAWIDSCQLICLQVIKSRLAKIFVRRSSL